MKLVNKKTRKKIQKTVRKAMKKHGDAVVASLVSGLTSSLATLAKTESATKPGKSNLGDLADRAKKALAEGQAKVRPRSPEKKTAAAIHSRMTRHPAPSEIPG